MSRKIVTDLNWPPSCLVTFDTHTNGCRSGTVSTELVCLSVCLSDFT